MNSPNSFYSYDVHKFPINCIEFFDKDKLLSCDSQIHLWSKHTGKIIWKIENEAYTTFSLLHNQNILAGAHSGMLNFLDTETGTVTKEWISPSASQSSVRSVVSVGENLVAAGYSSGIITLFDIRTGLIGHTWKAHNGTLTHLKSIGERNLLSASNENVIEMWDISQHEPPLHIKSFRAQKETTFDFDIKNDKIYIGSGSKLHKSSLKFDDTNKMEPVLKLSKSLKPNLITSIHTLTFHELALLGMESGEIKIVY